MPMNTAEWSKSSAATRLRNRCGEADVDEYEGAESEIVSDAAPNVDTAAADSMGNVSTDDVDTVASTSVTVDVAAAAVVKVNASDVLITLR